MPPRKIANFEVVARLSNARTYIGYLRFMCDVAEKVLCRAVVCRSARENRSHELPSLLQG